MDLVINNNVKSRRKSKKNYNKGIKVVYISSPMKVKTSASKFRALVQELTGRDSDAERYMEINGHVNHDHQENHDHEQFLDHHDQISDFAMSFESSLEPSFDDHVLLEEGFDAVMLESFMNECSHHQLDGLRSFGAV